MDQENIRPAVFFGEILFDIIKGELHLGGAPLNSAFALHQQDIPVKIISRVGNDELGRKALAILEAQGLDTSLIQKDETYPTGTVDVFDDPQGGPAYKIHNPVAFDFIRVDVANILAVNKASAFYSGLVAQRSIENQAAISILKQFVPADAIDFFDPNLRTDCFTDTAILKNLETCTVLKLNDDELRYVAKLLQLQPQLPDDPKEREALGDHKILEIELAQCDQIIKQCGKLSKVLLTRGIKGAAYIDSTGLALSHPGFPVIGGKGNTVGCGDNFAASAIASMLRNEAPEVLLIQALELAAWVATKRGGQPIRDKDTWRQELNDARMGNLGSPDVGTVLASSNTPGIAPAGQPEQLVKSGMHR